MDKCVCVCVCVCVCGAFILHTCSHMCGLIPCVFFAFAYACDTHVPFKLCTVCDCLSKNPPSMHLPVFQEIPF